jgi:hypothetical protein
VRTADARVDERWAAAAARYPTLVGTGLVVPALDAIVRALRPDELLLDFVIGPSRSAVFVLDRSGALDAVLLDHDAIAQAAERTKAALSARQKPFRNGGVAVSPPTSDPAVRAMHELTAALLPDEALHDRLRPAKWWFQNLRPSR